MVKILKTLQVPFGLAGVSIGSNLIGSKLGPLLPAGTTNPLTSIGTSATKAAGLTGTIALTGGALGELRKLQPKNLNVKLVKSYGKEKKL